MRMGAERCSCDTGTPEAANNGTVNLLELSDNEENQKDWAKNEAPVSCASEFKDCMALFGRGDERKTHRKRENVRETGGLVPVAMEIWAFKGDRGVLAKGESGEAKGKGRGVPELLTLLWDTAHRRLAAARCPAGSWQRAVAAREGACEMGLGVE
ncbi:hypothetical protein Anapl_17753 [Anas platyrhynchos]|uniref:Uncharacterized protein n=1 Tax=Anas platyrhynchos TaxID=8839 RepID=R0L5Q9_ANAPL|nr:hypothetical protein Anapl_17753 [Anas platyrhynchos]